MISQATLTIFLPYTRYLQKRQKRQRYQSVRIEIRENAVSYRYQRDGSI